MTHSEEPPFDTTVSKSRRKREMIALQALGEQLLSLTDTELETLALPDILTEAVRSARSIRSRGAHRRQLQYIGRLMRDIDPEPVRLALEQRHASQRRSARRFQQLESLRDQLIGGDDDELDAVLAIFPDADRQRIRMLTRQARKEVERNLSPKAARALFRYLRSLQETVDR